MLRKSAIKPKTFDQVVGPLVGVTVMGIIRLVIAGAMEFYFILYSDTVMTSTIVGAIVLPIIAIVLFALLKKSTGKGSKVILGLRAGILAAPIISLVLTIFGMSFFLAESGGVYSYTPFDAFIRDLTGLMETGGSTAMMYLIDDIFVIMILVFAINAILLATKSFPGRSQVSAPVQTQAPGPVPVPVTIPAGTEIACNTCGASKLHAAQKFCESCGAPFLPETVVQPAVTTEVSAPAAVSPPATASPVTPAPPLAPTISPAVVPPAPMVSPIPTPAPAPAAVPPAPSPVQQAATGSRPLQATKVDWNKVKDALKRAELKLEELAGKAYQRLFKKTPTQKTNRICIGLIALVIATSVILGFSLTPARQLAGTWKTSAPVKFNVEIGGVPSGYEMRTMTWVISAWGWDPNQVYIDIYITIEDHVTDSGYQHDFPNYDAYGTISSSRLTVRWGGSIDPRNIGDFSFTTWIITGTYDDTNLAGNRVYTATNGLTLTKQ